MAEQRRPSSVTLRNSRGHAEGSGGKEGEETVMREQNMFNNRGEK